VGPVALPGRYPDKKGSTVYARSTTIQAQPLSVDIGIAHVRDIVMPALEEIDGCVGLSLLVDRQSGTCIATSSWETMEAMRASAERVAPVRDQAALMFDGSARVEEWDIALLRRDHTSRQGACVRATWLKVVPDQLNRSLDFYRMSVLPELEELDGFCSASLLVDHPACRRAVSCSTFDSMEAMARNRDRASELRSRRVRDLGAEVVDVAEFELAIAHLRVPELV
jgi:heme-degrading monooxygenase HmoA